MTVHPAAFRGFANPVDPTPAELRAWAYNPDSVVAQNMPPEWDLLVAGDPLVSTLMELALDRTCPARRFALHCLYIYAADAIRTKFRAHPKRRLRKLVEKAEEQGDELLVLWAHNTRMLLAVPDLFDYGDWCEGGLVRNPRRLRMPAQQGAAPALPAPPSYPPPPSYAPPPNYVPSPGQLPQGVTPNGGYPPNGYGPSDFGPSGFGPPPLGLPGPRGSHD